MSNARVALRSGVVLAVLSLTVLGCGEEPKVPPELIGFSPASASVKANETLKIKVEYQKNDYELESFQWTAEAGAIEGNGQAEITYQAPDVAGDYELTVTAAYADDEGAQVLLATMVEVLPAEEPAAAVEPTPAAATEAAADTTPAPEAQVEPEAEAAPAAEAAASTETATDQAPPTADLSPTNLPEPPLGTSPVLDAPPITEPPLSADQIER